MQTQVLTLRPPSICQGILKGALTALMALLPLAALFTACSSGGKADVQMLGTWAVDVEALKETDEFKQMPEAERRLTQSMLNAYADVRFEITSDRMRMSGLTTEPEELEYTIKSVSGGKVTIETRRDGRTDTREVLVKGDRLYLKQRNHTLVLKRRK